MINNALENTDLDFARVENLIGKIQGLAFKSIENYNQNEITEEQWGKVLNKLNEYANTLPPSENVGDNFKVYEELIQLLPE